MKQSTNNKNLSDTEERNMENANIEKTLYPSKEDIYNQNKNEEDIDPQDISKTKEVNATNVKAGNNQNIRDAELNEEDNDDEENDYYSVGDELYSDLDEDKEA
jgi:hypothetical protein